ncbi:GxxExxY protein [Hymenobacter properus]|uniref:GxxExxY protein n=1 Tax=Hymenobacter properus TaxID=2791026 RepID=A0A931BCU4_9BACT|nr:GxxExxY protein [Hymenobacter properus]MBF9141500.1 GxxExxY protein [Hymenobacter properus]MBR7720309.1 GxxExxY protein [Microvirga sp. SRT04]
MEKTPVDLSLYKELTGKIIGCAMQVHRVLGTGFQEVIYQRALAIELEQCGVVAQRELEMPIYYRQKEIGSRRVDFLVNDTVLVELKALSVLNETHHAQIINYLEAYRLPVGLLINFGGPSLEYKCFVKTKPIY